MFRIFTETHAVYQNQQTNINLYEKNSKKQLNSMSARVFKPLIMSEMRRVMRGGGHLDLSESEVRSPRDNHSLERIKKCLFGPIDHNECKLFVQQELESHREKASKKWNFDFKTGKPKPVEEGCVYEWKIFKPKEPIPEAYALSRLPYLNQHADNNSESNSGSEDSQSCPSSSSSITSATRTVKCNKQAVITDFMRKQKVMRRIPSNNHKSDSLSSLNDEEPPTKKARACSS